MSKQLKNQLKPLGIVFLVVVILVVLVHLLFLLRFYARRCVECQPEELLPALEKVFDINFPDSLKKTKTAKSMAVEGDFTFLVRFVTDSDSAKQFIRSFPGGQNRIGLELYDRDCDLRKTAGFWRPPKWFTETISQGKMGKYDNIQRYGEMTIYIDVADDRNNVVYLNGYCPEHYEEEKQ